MELLNYIVGIEVNHLGVVVYHWLKGDKYIWSNSMTIDFGQLTWIFKPW